MNRDNFGIKNITINKIIVVNTSLSSFNMEMETGMDYANVCSLNIFETSMYFIPIIDDDNWNTRKILVGLKIQLTSKTMPYNTARLAHCIHFYILLIYFLFLFIYYAFF